MAGTGVIRKKLTDDEVINLLNRGPLTTYQIAKRIGRSVEATRKILFIILEKKLVDTILIEDEDLSRRVNLWSIKK